MVDGRWWGRYSAKVLCPAHGIDTTRVASTKNVWWAAGVGRWKRKEPPRMAAEIKVKYDVCMCAECTKCAINSG